jgi:membrane protease YdiL (CAAX protease family)
MIGPSIIAALLAASAGVWCWVFTRRQAGLPLIPLARRRPVPWLGRDVLFIFLIAWCLPGLAMLAASKFVGVKEVEESAEKQPAENEKPAKKLETAHPAEDLLGSGNWRMIAAATFLAVILAPVMEEFLFRIVLQGWLEAVWSRQRRKRRELREAPYAWLPILLPAALFALMHFRFGRAPPTPQSLNMLLLANGAQIAAYLVTLAVAITLLRFGVGASAADLGWQPQKLAIDGRLAMFALVAVTPPLVLLQVALNFAATEAHIAIAPDPIPLFFLALAFGVLYRRTHRIGPSLILHMAFNATSVAVYFVAK